eukprot:12975707-Alexandrium_andersonii.AAC.1
MGSSDTTGTLLRDSTELLEDFVKRCWEDSAAGCKQVVWLMHTHGHIGREDAIDLIRQVKVVLDFMAKWKTRPGPFPVKHLMDDPFTGPEAGL